MSFKIVPNPTFEKTIFVPSPEDENGLELTVRYKRIGKKALAALFAELSASAEFAVDAEKPSGNKKADAAKAAEKAEANKAAAEKAEIDLLLKVMAGWGIEEAFTAENIAIAVDNYPLFTKTIFENYSKAMFEAKTKN